jgi:asparagine synthase (glutamine-hydrolysing)
MIHAINPRLAAYPSAYGHAFDAPPPLRRKITELGTLLRPPFLRRYTYRVRTRWSRAKRGGQLYFLEPRYLAAVLDKEFPYLRRFFQIDRLQDTEQFRRVCTLELLFQRIAAVVD